MYFNFLLLYEPAFRYCSIAMIGAKKFNLNRRTERWSDVFDTFFFPIVSNYIT